MVLVLDDMTQNSLRKCKGEQVFLKITFNIASAVDLYKFLKQIKFPTLLQTCALISGASSSRTEGTVKISEIPSEYLSDNRLD